MLSINERRATLREGVGLVVSPLLSPDIIDPGLPRLRTTDQSGELGIIIALHRARLSTKSTSQASLSSCTAIMRAIGL